MRHNTGTFARGPTEGRPVDARELKWEELLALPCRFFTRFAKAGLPSEAARGMTDVCKRQLCARHQGKGLALAASLARCSSMPSAVASFCLRRARWAWAAAECRASSFFFSFSNHFSFLFST